MADGRNASENPAGIETRELGYIGAQGSPCRNASENPAGIETLGCRSTSTGYDVATHQKTQQGLKPISQPRS